MTKKGSLRPKPTTATAGINTVIDLDPRFVGTYNVTDDPAYDGGPNHGPHYVHVHHHRASAYVNGRPVYDCCAMETDPVVQFAKWIES